MAKHYKKIKMKKIIIIVLFIIIISSLIIIIEIVITDSTANKQVKEISGVFENMAEENNDRRLEIAKIRNEWPEVVGWLDISGTKINYPVCQTKDNEYYLNHTYKNEKNKNGSLFLDMRDSINEQEQNLLIYGHRNKYGLMFEDLIKYEDMEFWKENPIIRFTTESTDEKYMIFLVVKTKVYYQDETDIFKYYNFAKIRNKDEYDKYIEGMKKISLYSTNIEANYGEQLITLSTCEYSQENGRFVVVAKKIN